MEVSDMENNKIDDHDGSHQTENDKQKKKVSDHEGESSDEETDKLNSSKPKAEEETVRTAPSSIHKCQFCPKTFRCGKALGGHTRSHFQGQRKEVNNPHKVKIILPNLSKTTTNNANCSDDPHTSNMPNGRKNTCYLCNKDFPSKNALFGHMRSHPEREWKGVLPPKTPLEQNKEDNGDDAEVFAAPIMEPVPRGFTSWLVKDKRGRRCIGAAAGAENLVYLCENEYVKSLELSQATELGKAASTVRAKSSVVPKPCKEEHVKKIIKVYRRGGSSLKLGNKKNDDHENNKGKGLSECGDEKEETANWAKEGCCVKNIREVCDNMLVMKKKKDKREKSLVKLDTGDLKSDEDKSLLIKTLKNPSIGEHRSIHKKEKNIIVSIMEESKPQDPKVAEENNCLSHNILQMNKTRGPSEEEASAADEEASKSEAKTSGKLTYLSAFCCI